MYGNQVFFYSICVCPVIHLCLALCCPVDYSLSGSSVLGIFQAKLLEWIATSYSRDLPHPGIEPASLTSRALAGGFFSASTTWEVLIIVCLQCRRPVFLPWVGKICWIRKWQPTPVFLPGESHRKRSLAGYRPWGCKELNTTERLSLTVTKIINAEVGGKTSTLLVEV